MQDRDLLEAVAARKDRAAFAELCRRYSSRFVNYFRVRSAKPEDVEELVQEVMLTVWMKAESYDPRVAAVSTWMFTIARNKAIDRFRKFARPEVEDNDPAYLPGSALAPDAAISLQRQVDDLRDAIAVLPADQAGVIRASYFEGRSMPEIAEQSHIPVGTVKSRMRLAMEALRRRLRSEEDERAS